MQAARKSWGKAGGKKRRKKDREAKCFKINGFSKFSTQLSFALLCLTFLLPRNKDAFMMQTNLTLFISIQC